MTMIVILARGLCNRSAPAAVLVLMRCPAIPLSGAAFVRPGNCFQVLIGKAPRFWRACSGSILLLRSSKLATHLTQKPIEIPNNVT